MFEAPLHLGTDSRDLGSLNRPLLSSTNDALFSANLLGMPLTPLLVNEIASQRIRERTSEISKTEKREGANGVRKLERFLNYDRLTMIDSDKRKKTKRCATYGPSEVWSQI